MNLDAGDRVPHGTPHPALAGSPLGFAHRGWTPPAPGRAPHAWENTVAAFQAARELGVRHLELDVRATRDGVCVVVHDPDLRRVAGVDVRVADLTWDELSRLRVGGDHPVARLEEVLDAVPDSVLNVDCKSADAVQPLIRVLQGRADAARVVVAAFDGARSAAVARAVPAVALSAGPWTVRAAVLAGWLATVGLRAPGRWLLRAARRGSHALQVPERAGRLRVVSPGFVTTAQAVGLQVHVWVVDDPADMRRLLDLGVAGLVSDRADLLVEVLRERGPTRGAF